jgi:thiol-disulfide isomerase/thioredoxin
MPHVTTLCLCSAAALVLAASTGAQESKGSRLPELTGQKADDAKGLPPVFSAMSFEEALKSIEGTQKILIVKATAEWCGPCKQMDRTTWREDKVVQWVKDNGLAIAVDVDKFPAVAERLKIKAMPTMVAFRDGKELDRVVGARSGDQLITWLESAKKGEKATDAVRKKAEKSPDDVDARYALARQLVQDNEPEKAAEEFAWLWVNIPRLQPAMIPVRGSFMAGDMERLAAQNAGAKARFVALRDAAEKTLNDPANTDLQVGDDFIALNKIVGDQDRTLAWFDKVKADPSMGPVLQRVALRLEEPLEVKGRWKDMGTYLFADPTKTVEQAVEVNKSAMAAAAKAPAGMQDMMRATQDRSHCARMARIYASLLAAKRDADAEKVLAVIAPEDTGGRAVLACITKALEIGEARESMRAPLDVAWKKGAGIKAAREGLNRALKDKK